MKSLITVNAKGKASGRPDCVKIEITINTEASTANEARTANIAGCKKTVDLLKQYVDENALRVVPCKVNPVTDYNDELRIKQITGYKSKNTITVKILEEEESNFNTVLDEIANKANVLDPEHIQVSNIEFSLEDTEELETIARTKAMEEVYSKAKQFAKFSRLKIQRVKSCHETWVGVGERRPSGKFAATMDDDEEMEVGDVDMYVNITVVFVAK